MRKVDCLTPGVVSVEIGEESEFFVPETLGIRCDRQAGEYVGSVGVLRHALQVLRAHCCDRSSELATNGVSRGALLHGSYCAGTSEVFMDSGRRSAANRLPGLLRRGK